MTAEEEQLRADRLALAEALGKELARLGMRKHLPHLRLYYAAIRDGREPGKGEWRHAHVVELAQNLRVPPHDKDVPMQPWDHKCCAIPSPFTRGTFPGGTRMRCNNCKADWLVLNPWKETPTDDDEE